MTASGEVPGYLAPAAALVLAAAAVGYLSVRLRVIPIVGFLIAGILIGPARSASSPRPMPSTPPPRSA